MNGAASHTLRTEGECDALATANRVVADQDAAEAALKHAASVLDKAVADQDRAALALRELIVQMRPTGVLDVNHMGEAIGRDRNYIDGVWSAHGATTTGKQTRVPLADVTHTEREAAAAALGAASTLARKAEEPVKVARAERDRVVAMVYASKLIGPSGIARIVGVDRNHVLRLARKHGVKPMHRQVIRNQHSPVAEPVA